MYLFFKFVTNSDSMPMAWSILTHEQQKSKRPSVYRTSFYKSKSSTKKCTVPIKFEPELKEKYKKKTGLYIFKTKIVSYIIKLFPYQNSYLSILLHPYL